MTHILVSKSAGAATITLNRPEKLNAFAGTMRQELLDALNGCASDPETRALIITGAGRGFCAGGDVAYMSELQERGDLEAFGALLSAGAAIVMAIRSMPKIVIAAVKGVAAGAGCNLALACDYRLASSDASFGETFIRIGLHPDWGGSWLLPRLVGPGRALEMCATGRMVSATEAVQIGLADRVVDGSTLMAEAQSLAETIAAMPADAIAAIKVSIQSAEKKSLPEQLLLESEIQTRLFGSSEARERIAAFARRK